MLQSTWYGVQDSFDDWFESKTVGLMCKRLQDGLKSCSTVIGCLV